MMERRIASIALPLVVVLTLASCADSPPAPDMRDHPGMATAAVPLPENDAAAVNPGPVTAVFQAKLDPLNGSGVHGSALITVTATTMTVNLTAQGHEPDKLHVQHIHGFATAAASCPPASAAGPDGVLSFADGLPFYGPVQVNLAPFPTPTNGGGALHYREAFAVASLPFATSDLTRKVIVLHGMTIDGTYVASLPVACGPIVAAQ